MSQNNGNCQPIPPPPHHIILFLLPIQYPLSHFLPFRLLPKCPHQSINLADLPSSQSPSRFSICPILVIVAASCFCLNSPFEWLGVVLKYIPHFQSSTLPFQSKIPSNTFILLSFIGIFLWPSPEIAHGKTNVHFAIPLSRGLSVS